MLGYDMSRTQSIMRIATTASPVGGSEVRHKMLELAEETRRKWAVRTLQLFFRFFKQNKSEAEVMKMKAQLKSRLTEKGATRPSPMMCKKMPNGSSELQDMPRRREYPEGAEGEAEWCNDVDAASSSYGKAKRAQSTANEHDQYAWGFNEYAKRQGFPSFLERCGEGERPLRSSGTGRLKPTYDDKS